MTTALDEKRKARLLLLHKAYEATNGGAAGYFCDVEALGNAVGLDRDTAWATYDYLRGEGLMEPMGAQAAVITHPGVVEVEAALDNKPTPHFSMPVVLALHSQNTQIISGEGHHVSQAAPIFDQRDQTVTTQYNAAGDINVGAMKTVDELVTALDALKLDLRAAHDDGAISELVEAKTKTPLLEAIEEAKKPEPDKNKVLAFLDSAKLALGGVAAVGAIVDSIGKIYEWVKQHTL